MYTRHHKKPRFDKTPLVPQAVSRISAVVDRADALQRRGKTKGSLYPVLPEAFDALPGELALTRKAGANRRFAGGTSLFKTVMNGDGTAAQGVEALIDSYTAAGFVGNLARVALDNQMDDTSNVPLDTSGQITVPVTGDEAIHIGDLVYWDLPKTQDAMPTKYAPEGAPAGRVIPILRPYRVDSTSIEMGRMTKLRAAIQANREPEVVGKQFYLMQHRELRVAMMLGALLQEFGSVSGVVNAGSATLERRMQDYGLLGGGGSDQVSQMAHMLMAPSADGVIVTQSTTAHKALRAEMTNFQTRIVYAIVGMSRSIRDRIVGRAVSDAQAGAKVDLVIGMNH